MSDLKYYTPTIEELHVGYCCEVLNDDTKEWEEFYTTRHYLLSELKEWIDLQELRTPYLTEVDILQEFDAPVDKKIWSVKYWDVWNDSSKHNYIIRYRFENQRMQISRDDDSDVIFDGFIRCVNEFKTILKLLKI